MTNDQFNLTSYMCLRNEQLRVNLQKLSHFPSFRAIFSAVNFFFKRGGLNSFTPDKQTLAFQDYVPGSANYSTTLFLSGRRKDIFGKPTRKDECTLTMSCRDTKINTRFRHWSSIAYIENQLF